jgi:hypothetical protein
VTVLFRESAAVTVTLNADPVVATDGAAMMKWVAPPADVVTCVIEEVFPPTKAPEGGVRSKGLKDPFGSVSKA